MPGLDGPPHSRAVCHSILEFSARVVDSVPVGEVVQRLSVPLSWHMKFALQGHQESLDHFTIGGTSRGDIHGLARDIAESIRQYAVPGEPYFINARLGVNKQYGVNCKRGEKAATMTKKLLEACESDDSIDRPFYLLLPRDIAATYKRWLAERKSDESPKR